MGERQLKEYIDRKVGYIVESILKGNRKQLNEKWYPEEEDDIADYSFGMIATLSTRDSLELDEQTIANLQSISEEYCDNSQSYVSVLVRKVTPSCDEYGDCTLSIECAVSATDMPMGDIEEETEDLLWYWLEDKTGERLALGFDWEEERVVFDRRSKNK